MAPGKPSDASVMHAQPFRWWLRPVRNVERVGEQSAVVCHWLYIKPLSASFCSVGMLILPPNGDHAANPVSSYSTIKTFGAPCGARFSSYGVQSDFDSRTSSLMTPLNSGFMGSLSASDGLGCRRIRRPRRKVGTEGQGHESAG